ncbi:putative urea active transporter [Lachnellula subtilissima]|uniref:Putative urea active transporter n=1 Tax=Lachnellula subtilissima TaxID=602034 RepID=A0A8H8S1H5_9HELO|nr:putative urea active transporter [Lachnellula subtilissima]
MSMISLFLSKYFAEKQDSEMFMTAKHTVKTGLTASAVVSSWTIATTLLSSTSYGYSYGVSGPFWYGAGASVQILLFSVAAIELKRKAPNAQTFLQIAKHRYGAPAHIILSCYSLLYQTITSVSLLVGGSAVFSILTGVNRDAPAYFWVVTVKSKKKLTTLSRLCFLFPIGVVIYTLCGGIKATFLTDWVHTVVIFVIMLMSAFVVYSTSSVIGSSDKMWELLTTASELHPVEGNAEGSYLTMRSVEGGYIGLVFVGAGFAAAVDSQLFQKAIASDPAGTLGGYLLGGTSWFTIPFVLATTFGLTAAATEHLPSFPTYPNRMSSYEVASGLAMPYGALSVMGKGGAFAILLMVFMAVTSAMSSETVATTALLTYNFYQSYINPKATGKQLLRFSNFVVPGFALVASSIAVGLNHAGFSVSFLITISGILVDSAIVPMACTIMWSKQSKFAVIASPTISSACGIIAWLLTARSTEGVLTIATLSTNLPLVAGNMCSLCAPLVLTPLFTVIRSENYDFEKFKEVKAADDYEDGSDHRVPETDAQAEYAMEAARTHDEKNEKILFRARKWAIIASIVMTLTYLILWPIPMYATSYAGTITLLPIWESRDSLAKFARYIFSGKIPKMGAQVTEGMQPEKNSSSDL